MSQAPRASDDERHEGFRVMGDAPEEREAAAGKVISRRLA